jgi:hypothetical protein
MNRKLFLNLLLINLKIGPLIIELILLPAYLIQWIDKFIDFVASINSAFDSFILFFEKALSWILFKELIIACKFK